VFTSTQANTGISFNQQQAVFNKIRCRKSYTKESKICTSSNTTWRWQSKYLIICHNYHFTIASL